MTPQGAEALNNLVKFAAVMWMLGLTLFVMWLVALIDVIRSEFENQSNKTMWILLLLFLAPIAAVIYPLVGTGQKVVKEKKDPEKTKIINRIVKAESGKACREIDEKWF